MSSEISIDYYLNNKNSLQDKLNRLDQQQLIDVFGIITEYDSNVQFSKNKNGYFIDIKILPNEVIEKLQSKCDELLESD
jgi:hypothetical protein